MKSPTRSVVIFQSFDIVLGDFSHMLLVLHAIFRIQVFALLIPTADAEVTGIVSWFNFIV